MASADFLKPIASPLDKASPLGQASGSPGVRRVTFAPYTRRIYVPPIRVVSGFGSLCPLAPGDPPRMRFVFLGPELCLQLPSHSTSR